MNKFTRGIAILAILIFAGQSVYATNIEVTAEYDLKTAFDYVFTANIDTVFLATSGGVFTTTDTNHIAIYEPVVIMAKPGLAEKPIITNSDPNEDVLDILRIYDDCTIEGIVFDGGHAQSHGMKYALRLDDDAERNLYVNPDADLTVKNCDFVDFYVEKDVNLDGHIIKVAKVKAGTIVFENCYMANTGYEAIRLSDTEKWATEKTCDTLIVRNCTFENIDAECIRFYGDVDTANHNDAYVLLENLTVNNSATRVMYIKRNRGTTVRNIIITNSRTSGHARDDYLIQIQLPKCTISHIDTMNCKTITGEPGKEFYVSYTGGVGVDHSTIWAFDPMFQDAANHDFTLMAGSHAYYSGHDGNALGDLKWATNMPTVIPFKYTIVGKGTLEFDPPLDGLCYDPGTQVTITATPDEGYGFTGWGGDLSGSDNPATLTVDAAKNITATFEEGTAIGDEVGVPHVFALNQNYPNPFNPHTNIQFSLTKTGVVNLKIYDINGALVENLLNNSFRTAGSYTVNWTPKNVSSGVYFYQLKAEGKTVVKKMHYLR